MADDSTILEIGALINLTQFTPQMDQMVGATKAGTQAMAGSFQQLATTTASSTAQMTTAFVSVPAAAQVIPPAVRKVERDTAESTTKMGGWWRELAATIKTVGAEIIGTFGEVGAKMSETAERSRLGVGTMQTAFSGLSKLLGAGLAVDFAAHFLDETARVVTELEHLKTATGVSIETLAGLRAISQQAAVPFDQLQVGLIRMQRAQVLAVEGSQQLRIAFSQIGINLKELETATPDQLFFRIADGIGNAKNQQVAATSAMQLFGRGVYSVIPLLEQYGTGLRKNAEEAGRASGFTDKAAETTAKWNKETAQLSQLFQSAMIPVMQTIIELVPKIASGFDLIGASLLGSATPFAILFNEIVAGTVAVDRIILDFLTGNLRAIPGDAERAVREMSGIFTSGLREMTGNFRAVKTDWDSIFSTPPKKNFVDAMTDEAQKMLASLKKPMDLSDFLDLGKAGKGQMQVFREQLDQMRDAQTGFHELSKAEEADFWKEKLAIAAKTPALYREVYHEYVTAEREARKQSLTEEVSAVEQRVAAERSGSIQRVAILQEELGHLKSVGAEETGEYRRIQQQLVIAQKEATAEDAKEFTKRVSDELADESKSAQAKLNIIRNQTAIAELLYGDQAEVFKALKQEEIRAERQFGDEQKQIKSIDAEAAKAHEQSILDIRKAAIQNEFAIGLISATQRIAMDRQVITEEIALERQALEAKAALYKDQPVEYERVLKQIEALNDRYNKLLLANDNEMLRERMTGWTKFNQSLSQGFASAVGQMVQHGKGFGIELAQMWNQMLAKWAETLAQMLVKWVTTELAQLIFHRTVETQKAATTVAGEATQTAAVVTGQTVQAGAVVASQSVQTAATVAGESARRSVTLLSTLKVIGQAAAASAAKAFEAVVGIPYVGPILAPIAAAGAFAAVLAFRGLAAAKEGALLPKDMLVHAHEGELIVPKADVPLVLAAVGGSTRSAAPAISASSSTLQALNALPVVNFSLPGAIRSQFDHAHVSTASRAVHPDVASAIDRERGGGSALPGAARSRMEGALGADFSNVRIHTDSTAAKLSTQLNAHAFTVGRDIFFSQGTFGTDSIFGRNLLAHELVHTIQHGEAPLKTMSVSSPSDPAEREAYARASQVERVALMAKGAPLAHLLTPGGKPFAAAIGGNLFRVPAALAQNFSALGGSRTSVSRVVNNRNVSVNPHINVNVSGDESGMTDLHNQVVKIVKRAVRSGALGADDI